MVKVLNTWRLMILKNSSSSTPLRLSSPLALMSISLGLVLLQVLVTTIWLVTYPPHPGLYDGLWQCSQHKSFVLFDSEIIVSLLYIIQLLMITIFFAGLTWKCYDQNREPRWIMACAITTSVIWLGWLILSGIIIINFYYPITLYRMTCRYRHHNEILMKIHLSHLYRHAYVGLGKMV